MKMTGNTILITGGGSGIGRGLAEAFHALGNTVIISGRRQAMLDETVAADHGMQALTLDIDMPEGVRDFAARVIEQFPALNVVIHNAGIMRPEIVLKDPDYVATAEAILTTNVLGPIRLNAALLPLLLKQPAATVMTVTSGLAWVPLAPTPTYCASKAAIHSYTESLRYQLKDTAVEVLELTPPYVQTELNGPNQKTDEHAMPLHAFIAEVMSILTTQPEAKEILVKNVYAQRYAERDGRYDGMLNGLNAAMAARF